MVSMHKNSFKSLTMAAWMMAYSGLEGSMEAMDLSFAARSRNMKSVER